MKPKSTPHGKNISIEVSHISPHGLWLLIGEREYRLSVTAYPWFSDAKVADIHDVQLLHGHHLHWPSLDIDLDLNVLNDPASYPLVYKA